MPTLQEKYAELISAAKATPTSNLAAHDSEVTLLSKYNEEWALARSADGEEGYCSLKYLTPI